MNISNPRRFLIFIAASLVVIVVIGLIIWLVFFQSQPAHHSPAPGAAVTKITRSPTPAPVQQAVTLSLKAPAFFISIDGSSGIGYYSDSATATTAVYDHGKMASLTISNVLYTPTKYSCFTVAPTGTVTGSSYLRGLLPFLAATTTYSYPNAATIDWNSAQPRSADATSPTPAAPHGVIQLNSQHQIIAGTTDGFGPPESFTVNYQPFQLVAPTRCSSAVSTTTPPSVIVTTDTLPTTSTTAPTPATSSTTTSATAAAASTPSAPITTAVH